MSELESSNKLSKFFLRIIDRVGFRKKAREKTSPMIKDTPFDPQSYYDSMERLLEGVDRRNREKLRQEGDEPPTVRDEQISRTKD